MLDHDNCSVTTCQFSACGTMLASGDYQGVCRVFDLRGWNPLNSYMLGRLRLAEPLCHCEPLGDWQVTQHLFGHNHREKANETSHTTHTVSITALSFSANASMLASGSLDMSVRIWQSRGRHSATTQAEQAAAALNNNDWYCTHFIKFPGPVSHVQFAPVGSQVVANCLGDDRAYMWDLESMLDQHDAWHYQVLDCGDDKDEIVCTAAVW